jgi:hypothetical protein
MVVYLWAENEKLSEAIFDIGPCYGKKETTMTIRFKGDAFTANVQISVAKSSEGSSIGVDVAKMMREDNTHKSVLDGSSIGNQLHSIGSTSYHHHDHVSKRSPRRSGNEIDSYSHKRSKSNYGGDRPSSYHESIHSSSVTIGHGNSSHHDHADSERYRRELHEMKELNSEKSLIISKLKRELEHKDSTI